MDPAALDALLSTFLLATAGGGGVAIKRVMTKANEAQADATTVIEWRAEVKNDIGNLQKAQGEDDTFRKELYKRMGKAERRLDTLDKGFEHERQHTDDRFDRLEEAQGRMEGKLDKVSEFMIRMDERNKRVEKALNNGSQST